MDLVYQEHFGFSQAPFNITPDPGFFYPSVCHREGLAQLLYGIKARKGFIVLTGEVGTGKTTLIHALLNDLSGSAQTALVFSAITNPIDLLRYVCDDFGITDPHVALGDIHDYLVLLNDYLLERYRNGENCALIIDEAQNLPADVLESIRLLSNFETSKDKLLQIMLVGQPELAVRLNSQELRQLKQRVALRHHLRPLTPQESEEYVKNRLQLAHGDPGIFTPEALSVMFAYSKGIPRLMNVLGDNALLTAYALGNKFVDEKIIGEVAEDLSLSNGTQVSLRPIHSMAPSRTAGLFAKPNHKIVEFAQPLAAQPAKRAAALSHLVAPGQEGKLGERFFLALRSELTDAMGPMASIVLQDNVQRLGQSIADFPKKKLPMLIESISIEILDPALRQAFCKAAFDRIRELA